MGTINSTMCWKHPKRQKSYAEQSSVHEVNQQERLEASSRILRGHTSSTQGFMRDDMVRSAWRHAVNTRFDKTKNVDTQGGTLVETSTIPETQFQTVQGSMTIAEFGNSVPFSGKLQTLGQFQVEPITEQKLRDDQVKVLESAVGAELVKTDFTAVCASTATVTFSTNSSPAATATANLTAQNVRQIVDFMAKKLIPFYDGQSYVCIASVGALSGMHSDTGSGGWVDVNLLASPVSNHWIN